MKIAVLAVQGACSAGRRKYRTEQTFKRTLHVRTFKGKNRRRTASFSDLCGINLTGTECL